ncbi:hypothetical protein EB118_07345 [bacterium]|nr:hypothetical protein [bacterium]
MPAIVTHKFRIHNAQQFTEAFDETANTVVYLYVGGPSAFGASNDGGTDPSPPTPTNSTANVEYLPWNDMIGAKRATAADVSLAIPRYNWTSGTTYKMYDDADTNLIESDDFYVMTDEYNVYKCLRNSANGVTAVPSTTKPTGVSTDFFETADNYVWKFMYKVTTSDALKFLTNDYIPVKLLTSDDGSDQWDVQSSATDGGIQAIKVTAGGSGYTNGNGLSIVTITGDGTGATATANVTSGILRSITVTNKGTGYNNATISITGANTGTATATAVISPRGGHGSNPVEELGGKYAMVNVRLDGNEANTISTANDFRKVGLIRDPYDYGTTTRALATNKRQTFRYTVTSTSNIVVDDTMTVGANTAKVIEVDTVNSYVFTTKPLPRNFTAAAFTTSSGGSGTISSISTPGLQPYSGDVMYTEYRSPISRAEDQIEDVKLIIEF